MTIAIYGAGAIGGYLGALLDRSGVEVSLIARGAHLTAIQESGLRLDMNGETITTHPRATDNPADLGEQDYVIVALKAHSAPQVVDQMQPLLGPHTAVVTAMNGVPWWYFYGLESQWGDRQLETVDPSGKQWKHIGPERAIGCVVYPACEIVAPSVNRLPLIC